MKSRPKILTIAGFDPSGGAGILADVKTIESHRCQAFAVNTANTIQNEEEFISPNWIDETTVFSQLELLLKLHQFHFVKIGLVPSIDFLKKVIQQLSVTNCQIIWDPILSTSSGFDFKHDLSDLKDVLKNIFLLTPNWDEIKLLSNNDDALEGAKQFTAYTNVYLKGGHNQDEIGKDFLFYNKTAYPFNTKKRCIYPKHGSGCVLSSALIANIALGYPMIKACLRSKSYVTQFLTSSSKLLGNHKM